MLEKYDIIYVTKENHSIAFRSSDMASVNTLYTSVKVNLSNFISIIFSFFFNQSLDLRIEHFHCFSDHGEGGHYHYDVTPDHVHYTGFFSLAEKLYRIDRPLATHHVGRD